MSEALYKHLSFALSIPQAVFVELMESAMSSVEFSFNDTMYKQMDGVAMGLPLERTFSLATTSPNYFLTFKNL